MSDLFSPLRDSTEPLPTSPEDVRRRGDQARRRRTTLVAGGAAVVVAAVASGVMLLGPEPTTQIQPAPPSPSPTPTDVESTSGEVEAPTAVPDDFPLEVGMVEGETVNDDPWLADIEYCDANNSMADLAVDDRFAQSLLPGTNQFRSFELFESAKVAKARALDHVEKFRSCPEYTTETGTVARTEVSESGLGDQGWTVSRSFTNDGEPQFGQEIYQIVRSGNALLVTELLDEGPGSTDPQRFAQIVQQDTESSYDLVWAMCAWSEEGCVGG